MAESIYIIAEVGINHNGSITMAKELIDVAMEAGADAVKFQTFDAKHLVTHNAPKADYQYRNTCNSENQYEMLKRLEISVEEHIELFKYCCNKGMDFLSTPFDLPSLTMLIDNFDLPYIKIASGDITNLPFLLRIAQYGKPVILSTGMSFIGEVETALAVLAFGYLQCKEEPNLYNFYAAYCTMEGQNLLKRKVTVLHCTTEYPTPYSEVNLCAMDTMQKAFGLAIGLSDHTPGIAISIAAAARGAKMIEKHFTLDKNLPGPDHQASLEPIELKMMVTSIRQVEQALGNGVKLPSKSEVKNIPIARKSLVIMQDIDKGQLFSEVNLGIKRPGDGISPVFFWDWLGRSAERDYKMDELLNHE